MRNVYHKLLPAVSVLLVAMPGRAEDAGKVQKIDPPRQGFFSKVLVVRGIPVLAHADVGDAAVEEAARRIDRQLGRAAEIAANLSRRGVEMHVIGKDQQVSDLPEYRHMRGKAAGKELDRRGRGYGGFYASCAEENLLRLPCDRYKDHRDICSHEFAHTILTYGLSREIHDKIESQRKKSLGAGKWHDTYAGSNTQEFFAELSMWYFGSRGDYGRINPPPSEGAEWLRSYDPEAFELLDSIYGGRLKPAVAEVADLAALPADAAPKARSRRDQPPAELLVLNRSDQGVRVFWLDFDGTRRSRGTVLPGCMESLHTCAGHAWIVEADDGRVLGVFMTDRRIGRIVVPPRAKPVGSGR